MELKVIVDGFVRVVCGVSEETTCQDIVIALARAIGRAGRFSLLEKWRNQERSLPPWEKPFLVLQKWGQYASDVQFVLQQTDTIPATAANKMPKECLDKSGASSNDAKRAQNLSPVSSQAQDYSVKRSLTFSGPMYSSQEKLKPSRSHTRRSLPLGTINESSAASPQISSQSHHHHHHNNNNNQVPKQPQYRVNSSLSSSSYQQNRPEPSHSNQPYTRQHHQQQSQQQQKLFQNQHPYTQKPISSIKPQPKPRNLPLKSINEKQPVRTVGTVSPIQSNSHLSLSTNQDLPNRILHNKGPAPNSQNRPGNVGDSSMNNNSYYSKNTKPINTNNNSSSNNNNDSNSHRHLQTFKSVHNDVDKVLSEKSTYSDFKDNPDIDEGKNKVLSSFHSNRILSDIEEYDLEKNYPFSAVSPMPSKTAEYYRIQGQNYVDQLTRDQDPQILYQLVNQQHNEIELKKTLIKDLDEEIVSAEELLENRKEIAAFESLSNSFAEELSEIENEDWQSVVDKEFLNEEALKSELVSHRQKLNSMEDQLQRVDSEIADLNKQLEFEVNKCQEEISTIQKKIDEETAEEGKREKMLNELTEQVNQIEKEFKEKQQKEAELMERVKDLNLKDLEKSSVVGTNKTAETGTGEGFVLKLLEKQHQAARQSTSGSKDVAGCRSSPEDVVQTEDNSVLSAEGVWV